MWTLRAVIQFRNAALPVGVGRVHPNGKAIADVVEAMLPAIEGISNVELTR